MTIIEKATIMHYHRHRMEVCGHGTTKALGWKDDEHQRKRFEVLATVADLTGCSVLDVGCDREDVPRGEPCGRFNVLDVNVFPTHPLLVGHDLDDVTAWCRAMTPHVMVVRGYLEDDVTVFLYKEKPDLRGVAHAL